MKALKLARFLVFLLVFSLVIAGCSPATPVPATPVPTMDPATMVAAAVSTISADMTAEALRNPSPTPQPTATTAPTDTPVPPTETPEPVTATPATPEATATSEDGSYGPVSAKALYTTTYPENKRNYIPNEKFGLALGFLNNGTVDWDEDYMIQVTRVDGEKTVQPDAKLGRSVRAGEKAEFNVWGFGSETLGQHTWYFQVYTSGGIPVPGGFISFTYTSE